MEDRARGRNGLWQGASDEHIPRSVRSEQRRQRPFLPLARRVARAFALTCVGCLFSLEEQMRLSRFARLSVTEPLAMLCRLPPESPFGLPMAGCLAPLGSPRALASAKAGSNAVFPIYFTGSQRTAAW